MRKTALAELILVCFPRVSFLQCLAVRPGPPVDFPPKDTRDYLTPKCICPGIAFGGNHEY